jgi:AraC-like DNA-binding protein
MEEPHFKAIGEIFFSCKTEKYRTKEIMIGEHALIKILSGELIIVHADTTFVLDAGNTVLIPRNQLGKITKCPKDAQPFKSISIFLTQVFLQKYYASHKAVQAQQDIPKMITFDQHPLLESLFDSMLPYFTLSGELPADIAAIKVEEAMTILRSINKNVDNILGHFADPGKIALADFMERNYMFNLPMKKFGYLTGRSLTTFKKDFKNAFNTTFQKWVTRKRLELAHYQIFEQKKKPSDVYFEVGFENLSHFSFAFKKQFGYNPTSPAPHSLNQVN